MNNLLDYDTELDEFLEDMERYIQELDELLGHREAGEEMRGSN